MWKKCGFLVLALTVCLRSQTQTPAAEQADSPGPPMTFGKVDFALMLDGYYSFNNNHPITGFNQLYNFNDKTDQIGLNFGKVTISHDADPIGFRFDVGGGRAIDLMGTPSPDPTAFRYLEQAFISVKPKSWKGLEIDLGKFVTTAGAEVVESKDNWNYSRALLYALAIPYYHFGVRTSMPIGSSFTLGYKWWMAGMRWSTSTETTCRRLVSRERSRARSLPGATITTSASNSMASIAVLAICMTLHCYLPRTKG